jgi:hypothetical protein
MSITCSLRQPSFTRSVPCGLTSSCRFTSPAVDFAKFIVFHLNAEVCDILVVLISLCFKGLPSVSTTFDTARTLLEVYEPTVHADFMFDNKTHRGLDPWEEAETSALSEFPNYTALNNTEHAITDALF